MTIPLMIPIQNRHIVIIIYLVLLLHESTLVTPFPLISFHPPNPGEIKMIINSQALPHYYPLLTNNDDLCIMLLAGTTQVPGLVTLTNILCPKLILIGTHPYLIVNSDTMYCDIIFEAGFLTNVVLTLNSIISLSIAWLLLLCNVHNFSYRSFKCISCTT